MVPLDCVVIKHGLIPQGGKNRQLVFENRVLRRMFGPKREAGENRVMQSFIICTLEILLA
jgi:hypothetical protein